MCYNVFVNDFVAFGTKLAKREERARNPLGFLDTHITGYAMNYTRCCVPFIYNLSLILFRSCLLQLTVLL